MCDLDDLPQDDGSKGDNALAQDSKKSYLTNDDDEDEQDTKSKSKAPSNKQKKVIPFTSFPSSCTICGGQEMLVYQVGVSLSLNIFVCTATKTNENCGAQTAMP